MKKFFKASVIAGLLMLCIGSTFAQSSQLFSPADSVTRLELRYMHPFYKSVDKQGIFSGSYDFAFSQPLNKGWNLQFSLPLLFAKYERENEYYFDTPTSTVYKNGVGNIMLGVNKNKQLINKRLFSLYLQLYLPTGPKDYNEASQYSLFANVYELQKYLGDVTTLLVKVAYHTRPQQGWFYALNGGAQYHIAGDDADIEDDLYFKYNLTGGYIADNNIAFSCEYQGIINLTTSYADSFRDRMIDGFNFGLHYTKGKFNPSVFYSFYLDDDMKDIISGSLGIKLAYRFAD